MQPINKFLISLARFLPITLLLGHLRNNQVILLLWLLLFSIINFGVLGVFGIPYLFLEPEYHENVNTSSLFILGLTFGLFIMAFHITSYIYESGQLKFLSSVTFPFIRFSINNSIIPVVVILSYIYQFTAFQTTYNNQPFSEILLELLTFISAITLVIFLTFLYFALTNRDYFRYLAKTIDKSLRKNILYRSNRLKDQNVAKAKQFRIDYYIDLNLRIRKVDHQFKINQQFVSKYLSQNHLNALALQLVGLVLFILLGHFRSISLLQIPAGASILIALTLIMMFIGAFNYWFKGWVATVVFAILLFSNLLFRLNILDKTYPVYGLNYDKPPKQYTNNALLPSIHPDTLKADSLSMISTLNSWRTKFDDKPKMIFLAVSGGGLRACYWTANCIESIENELQNKSIFNNTFLISGASGGMLAAAYYRELYKRSLIKNNKEHPLKSYKSAMGKDMLNSIAFGLVSSDIFLRTRALNKGGYSYSIGRGFDFEYQLNNNTSGLFDYPIIENKGIEFSGSIPLLFIAPSLVDEGRKLYISPLNISFMNTINSVHTRKIYGLEFYRFFKNHSAENLSMLTALRMNATFPYVTPAVSLPTIPKLEVMDAGILDNYGVGDASKFIYEFKEWINENTSGVIIIKIMDSDKEPVSDYADGSTKSLFRRLFNPIGTLYNQWTYVQMAFNDSRLETAEEWLDTDIDIIELKYFQDQNEKEVTIEERASLSWHLTNKEKQNIERTIEKPKNRKEIERLVQLLVE